VGHVSPTWLVRRVRCRRPTSLLFKARRRAYHIVVQLLIVALSGSEPSLDVARRSTSRGGACTLRGKGRGRRAARG